MKLGASAVVVVLLVLAGCGGSGDGAAGKTQATATSPAATGGGTTNAKLPPGAVGPVDTTEQAAEGPAATEASPGEPAQGPRASGQLSSADSDSVEAVVRRYVAALDHRDAKRVCRLIATSCGGSIGARPKNGGPAWRRTEVVSLKVERLSGSRARVSGHGRPSLLRSQVRLRRGRRHLSGEGWRPLAARQAERDLLPRRRLRAAAAAGVHASPGLVAEPRSGGCRRRGGRARGTASGACGPRRRSRRRRWRRPASGSSRRRPRR